MKRLVFLALALALSACDEPPPPEQPPPKPKVGRAETQTIRNTDAIGYSGSDIANKVDAGLDAYDKKNEEIKKEVDQQTE